MQEGMSLRIMLISTCSAKTVKKLYPEDSYIKAHYHVEFQSGQEYTSECSVCILPICQKDLIQAVPRHVESGNYIISSGTYMVLG